MLITTQSGTLRVYQGGALLATPALTFPSGQHLHELRARPAGRRGRSRSSRPTASSTSSTRTASDASSCSGSTTPRNRVSRFMLPDEQRDRPRERDGAGRQHAVAERATTTPATCSSGATASSTSRSATAAATTRATAAAAGANDAARDQHVLIGKILRITRDGGIPADQPLPGRRDRALQRHRRHHRGQPLPGDLRLGPAQPVPHRLRPQRRRHAVLHQRRGPERWRGDRPRPGRRRLRLELPRGRAHEQHHAARAARRPPGMVGPGLRVRARRARSRAPPARRAATRSPAAPSCPTASGPGYDGAYLFSDYICGWMAAAVGRGPAVHRRGLRHRTWAAAAPSRCSSVRTAAARRSTTRPTRPAARCAASTTTRPGNDAADRGRRAARRSRARLPLTVTFNAAGSTDPEPRRHAHLLLDFGDGAPEAHDDQR